MIDGKKVLAVIPARGGSKGLPGKNIRDLGQKPLIAWTIEAALSSDIIDHTIVSTDCDQIAEVSKHFGADVPFVRPHWLSTDEASSADVVLHTLTSLSVTFDIVILLQPTSPFRDRGHIEDALKIYVKAEAQSLVSICEAQKSPYWFFSLEKDGALLPVLRYNKQFNRRQDLPKTYALNGAIYVVDVELFLRAQKFIFDETVSYLMELESSLDIDTLMDFNLAQLMLDEK
ncbi:acylneuraminate cytidylyltransferase family protein [Pseudomonadales bacterium]|nr:acylneuraminate cytidylyltransferase family protein [Pseudomonadales bacterium]